MRVLTLYLLLLKIAASRIMEQHQQGHRAEGAFSHSLWTAGEFDGLGTQSIWREAEDRLLNCEELMNVVAGGSLQAVCYFSPSCGTQVTTRLFPGSPSFSFQIFDQLAVMLRAPEVGYYETLGFEFNRSAYCSDLTKLPPSKLNVGIEYVGSGIFWNGF